ncbi:MAG: hypothetical protein ACM3MM_07620 [Acidobacteriota bacterium]
MSTDDDARFDDDAVTLSEEQQRAVDELGHRAGAALRRPAPEQGLAGIRRRATTQRLMRGGVAVAGIAALVVAGMVVLGGGDDDLDRMVVTDTVPTVPEIAPPTVPTVPAPIVETVPTTTPATAPANDRNPTSTTWSVASPSSIDMQPHAGSPPAMMLVTDNGTTVTVRNPWQPDVTTSIRPTDDNGTPLVVDSLRSTLFLTIAVTDGGRIVQVDPWHGSSTLWSHPGEVTDVSPNVGARSGFPLMFWSAGFDVIDGQRTPVVWYNTGPVANDQGTVTGVPTATAVAAGDPGGTTAPLITGNDTVAYALLPEPDGTSRLWIVQPNGLNTQRTDLGFREPTAMAIGGDRNLWVADADGLHVVQLETPDMSAQTVWDTPIRSLWPNFNDLDHAVLVLDDNGVVASLAGSGDAIEHYRDEAATAMLAHPFGLDGQPQLVLVHGDGDEVLIVDLDVFPDGGAGGWSWG